MINRLKIKPLIICCAVFVIAWVYLTEKPVISVVMSTHNRSSLLPRAIESVLNQSFTDFEFIIVDDGSTDDTASVLKSYAEKDGRIKVVLNETNKGLVYSLNRGLDLARGKYIARMDDDDISLPNRFAAQVSYLETYPDITVLGTAAYINEEKKSNYYSGGSLDEEETAVNSYIQVPVLHPTTMIRRAFIDQHQIRYSSKYPSAEDTYFWYLITINGGKIRSTSEPLLVYSMKSTKFSGYRGQQRQSYVQFLKDVHNGFMDTTYFKTMPTTEQGCYILKHLRQQSRTGLNPQVAQRLYERRNCKRFETK